MKKGLYQTVSALVIWMEVGEQKEIAVPDNLPLFRKYLSDISKAHGCKFTTKIVKKRGKSKMIIMRVPYSNIISGEVQI